MWERILPHTFYNKIWQMNIIIGQAYWNESKKLRVILGGRRLTAFKEFCFQSADKERLS